jgi:hypothetical protein
VPDLTDSATPSDAESDPPQSKRSAVNGVFAKLLLDAKQLIVFGHAIGAAQGASLDLAGIRGDGDVSDGRVLGFTRAMADDRGVFVPLRQFDGIQGFREGTNLIDFDEN